MNLSQDKKLKLPHQENKKKETQKRKKFFSERTTFLFIFFKENLRKSLIILLVLTLFLSGWIKSDAKIGPILSQRIGELHPNKTLSIIFCFEQMEKTNLLENYFDFEKWITKQQEKDEKLPFEYHFILAGKENYKKQSKKFLGEYQESNGSFRNSIISSSLAVFRRVKEGEEAEGIKRTIEWIENKQRPDGGWAFITNNESKFYPTSHALGALIYGYNNGYYEATTTIEKGIKFILKQTYKKNQWISPTKTGDYSATHKLCQVVLILEHWGRNNQLANSGVEEIKKRQLSDGSWGNYPKHNATCLWALDTHRKNN